MGVFTGIALGLSAVGLGTSIVQGRKASKASAAGARVQAEGNRLRNEQARRAFLRKFRQSQADTLTMSVASGVGLGSSRTQGTLGSERSQAATAVREFEKADELGTEFIGYQNKASLANFQAGVGSTVANFASQFVTFGDDE